MTDPDIQNDPEAKRYLLRVGSETAVVAYNLTGSNLMITETLVPRALEGQGIASRMARHVVDDARSRGLHILPVCPYFSAWLKKHPRDADVVHPTYRGLLGLD